MGCLSYSERVKVRCFIKRAFLRNWKNPDVLIFDKMFKNWVEFWYRWLSHVPIFFRVSLGLRVTSRVRALVDHRPKLDLCLQLRYS